MNKKIISFVLTLGVVASTLTAFEAVGFASNENLENQNTIIYIDELGIYATTGATGVFTSVDGVAWAKRQNASEAENLTGIVWGGAENDKKALMSVSGDKDSLVVTEDFNSGKNVAAVVGDVDSWDNIAVNTKMVWDEYSEKFYCGALQYSDGEVIDMGLYSSDGVVKDGGFDYGMSEDLYMLWERFDLGEADVFKSYLDNKAPFTDIEVDNNGRMALVIGRRLKNSDTDNGTGIIGHYIDRYIIFHDFALGKTAGIKTNLQAAEICFDDTGFLFCGAQVSGTAARQAVATYDFDAVLDKLDGVSGIISNNGARVQDGDGVGSKESNTNVVKNRYMRWAPKGYGLLENKEGSKFMVIVPKKGETTIADDRHNDLGFIQYNEEGGVIKNKYYTFVNDDEVLEELLGNYTDEPKTVMGTAVKSDRSEMVVLTKNDTFVIKADDVKPLVTDPASNDALRGKLIEKGTGAVSGVLSHVAYNGEDEIDILANEEYLIDVLAYDVDFDEAETSFKYEISGDEEKIAEVLDLSELNDGIIKGKESYFGSDMINITLKVKTDVPSVFLYKNLKINLKSDIEVLAELDKTSDFMTGDTLGANVTVTNNSQEKFYGYAVVFVKQGYKYLDFVVENVTVEAEEKTDINIEKLLENEDYSDAVADVMIIDKAMLFDVE